MARNALVPGFIRLYYTTVVSSIPLTHVMNLGVASPNFAVSPPTVQKKDTTTINWTAAVDALVLVLKPLFQSTTTFSLAELYQQVDVNSAPVLKANYNPAAVGTGGATTTRAGQVVFTCKSANGSLLRLTLLESNVAVDLRQPYASMTASEKALIDYVTGATTWIYTRGNSFPLVMSFKTSKENDKLRKLRLNL